MSRTKPRARRRVTAIAAPAAAALLLLAGCASSQATDVALAPPPAITPAPQSISVEVTVAPTLGDNADAQNAAEMLHAALLKRFGDAGVTARTATAPAPARLTVQITRADKGNGIKRMFAGFGAGRSALQTVTTFQVTDRNTPSLSFSSTTKSSRKPGLMLPGAVAAATGDASRFLIGGGVNLLIPSRAGIPHEADRSAKLIVKQTRELYRASGWTWPQDIKART